MATISRAQKVRLGIFVGTGLFVLLGAFVLLAGRALLEQRDFYKIRFGSEVNLSGLEPGANVMYGGIKIGRVEKMQIAEDNVGVIQVSISVDDESAIPMDSKASLASQGLTGLKYIELSRGTEAAGRRSPGDTIPAGPSLMDELSARAMTIGKQLEELLQNLQTMTGPETQRNFQQILSSTAGLLQDNRKDIALIVDDVHRFTGDMTRVSSRVVTVAERANRFMGQLNRAGDQIEGALADDGKVMQAITKADGLLERVNMLILRSEHDLDVTLRYLREASANLSDFSLAIRENPSILINNPEPKEDTVGR